MQLYSASRARFLFVCIFWAACGAFLTCVLSFPGQELSFVYECSIRGGTLGSSWVRGWLWLSLSNVFFFLRGCWPQVQGMRLCSEGQMPELSCEESGRNSGTWVCVFPAAEASRRQDISNSNKEDASMPPNNRAALEWPLLPCSRAPIAPSILGSKTQIWTRSLLLPQHIRAVGM